MTLLSHPRRATTSAPIHDLLSERWSPRSFDPEYVVPQEHIVAMLEAARWAPSAANLQSRRFLVARRGSLAFDLITQALAGGNRPWAPSASLYVVAVVLPQAEGGEPHRWA